MGGNRNADTAGNPGGDESPDSTTAVKSSGKARAVTPAVPGTVILGLETSTHSGGAALLRTDNPAASDITGTLTGSVSFTTRQLYSQRLLPTIEWLLNRTQMTVADVDVVGISIGPGSFTGLRIGLSVAKALAYASGAKIVGVGTLEALAVRASGGRDALVCPMLDARQGQVYAALYQVEWQNGLPQVTPVRPDWAGPVDDVAPWITQETIFAGDALALAAEKLRGRLGPCFRMPPIHQRLPHPEDVALLTAARAAKGQFDDPISLEPHYVRQTYIARTKGADPAAI